MSKLTKTQITYLVERLHTIRCEFTNKMQAETTTDEVVLDAEQRMQALRLGAYSLKAVAPQTGYHGTNNSITEYLDFHDETPKAFDKALYEKYRDALTDKVERIHDNLMLDPKSSDALTDPATMIVSYFKDYCTAKAKKLGKVLD